MAKSTQHKLDKIRKPRVHITYDVETLGAEEKRELPFVVGVVGDFSGNPKQPLKPLKERKFIQIDRDNFNQVMARMTPGATFRVENTLAGDGSEMSVDLQFNSIEDFEPANVVNQVDPLKKLLATRNKLRDLLTKVDLSEDLENVLEEVLENTDKLKEFSDELGLGAASEAPPAAEPPADEPDSSGPQEEDDQ